MLLAGALVLSMLGVRPAAGEDWQLEVTPSKTDFRSGSEGGFRLEAETTPEGPDRVAVVQEHIDGAWVAPNGREDDWHRQQLESGYVAWWIKTDEPGVHRYRVVVPATSTTPRLVSDPIETVSREWVRLGTLTPDPDTVKDSIGVNLGGHYFYRALSYPQCDAAETWIYRLRGRYETFRAFVGLRRGAEREVAKTVTITSGDATWTDPSLSVGEGERVVLDVTGNHRLRISVSGSCEGTHAWAALGEPELLLPLPG